ncbi:hypothetical protein CONPUDRAFT_80184 [Coniophora puteana RWD-64-598 SS2]|uniref:Uncharacterized protein n=1 Tax=Coniophora puteana (strain RWD-64-598) TaxID=741705 RepID=A0A5M3N337_CONPW|nr:uncharacterized protein CONPUDRAFT_80184 [Coniophora puteana RWD-64-598 SS2]EIW85726.1 hypothetical protein CONPUDRAFT_80184 [Coniophora puteana RWD-64-598 SS2]
MKPKAKGQGQGQRSGQSGPGQGISRVASAADPTPPGPGLAPVPEADVGTNDKPSGVKQGAPALSRNPSAASDHISPPFNFESFPQAQRLSRQSSPRQLTPGRESDPHVHLHPGAAGDRDEEMHDPDAVMPHVASGDDREPTELSPHVPYQFDGGGGGSAQTINKLSEMSYLPPSFPSHLDTSTPLRDGSLDALYRRKPSPIAHVPPRLSGSPVERRSEEEELAAPVPPAPVLGPQRAASVSAPEEESIPGLGARMDGVVGTPEGPSPVPALKAGSKRPRSVTPPSLRVRDDVQPGDLSVAIDIDISDPGAAGLANGGNEDVEGEAMDAAEASIVEAHLSSTDYAPAAKRLKVQQEQDSFFGPVKRSGNGNSVTDREHDQQLDQIREYAQKHLRPQPVFPVPVAASSNTPPRTPVQQPRPVRAGGGAPAFGLGGGADPDEGIPNSALPTLGELLASSRKAKVRPRPPSRKGMRTGQGQAQDPDADPGRHLSGFDTPNDNHNREPIDIDEDREPIDLDGDEEEERPHTPERGDGENVSPSKSYFSSPASGVSPGATTALPIRSPVSPMFAIGAADITGGGGFAPPFTSTQHAEEYVPPLKRGGSGMIGGFGGYSSQVQVDMEGQVERVSELLDKDVDFDGWLRDVVSASAQVEESRDDDSD